MSVESIVGERYAEGAREKQEALCCPVNYDAELLALLPREIVEKDYGCGDPSRYVREGDTVVDLGCGGGKICYMAARLAGPRGSVIGLDMTDEMLEMARRYRSHMAEQLGYDIVDFRKGLIQDVGELVAPGSADLVVSNCVLNLVAEEAREKLLAGVFAVLKPGGRVAISDIVASAPVPGRLKADPELWSGCISGAFERGAFLDAFAGAGFEQARYDSFDERPWREIDGIGFHSATVWARKPGPDSNSAAGCCG